MACKPLLVDGDVVAPYGAEGGFDIPMKEALLAMRDASSVILLFESGLSCEHLEHLVESVDSGSWCSRPRASLPRRC